MNINEKTSIQELESLIEEYKYEILEQNVELDDFFNNSPFGYINLDSKGNILKANVTILDLLGYSKKQLLAIQKIENLVIEENRAEFQKIFHLITEGKNQKNLEIIFQKKNYELLDVYLSGKIISNHEVENSVIRLTIIDVSEKKQILKKLEEKNNQIISQNKIMKKDLALAARIQSSLLPKENSIPNISTLYLPLEKVGGDFFDFIHFENENKIGIFISDVAGHGIPSAFITVILKSTIQQMSKEVLDNPEEFLSILNDLILQYSDGRFVTAIYVVIDYDSKKMRYSCAGHPPPFLISKTTVQELEIKNRRYPLGIDKNEQLKKTKRGYQNEEKDLKEFSKILFFTDGLTEATINSETNSLIFYEDRFIDFISGKLNLNSKELIREIFLDLLTFLGGEALIDDICIIGVNL